MRPKEGLYLVHGLGFLSLLGYLIILYVLERHQTLPLFLIYGCLFAAYWVLYRSFRPEQYKSLVAWAVLFRLALLFGLPNLSDDVYRFIWDGRLLAQGINPFDQLPHEFLQKGFPPGLDMELYQRLNSPEYYTIYPPVAQFTFWLGALLFPSSNYGATLVMKLFLLAAEIGNIILIPRLLNDYGLNRKNSLIYILNPLVVIELVGNLHAEGLMLFFVFLSAWLIQRKWHWGAALSFGVSIATKLIPVIFLPLFLRRISFPRIMVFYTLVGMSVLVLFAPLLSKELFGGLQSSFSLYFQKFEFNASIYYVVREIGFWVTGYNIIATSGKYMAVCATVGILIFTYYDSKTDKNLLESSLWVLLIYLLFATTLHPWYVITLVGLSVFSSYRFPVVWTLTVFLSYSGYSPDGFEENLWLVTIEYIVVAMFLALELMAAKGSLIWTRSSSHSE